MGFSFLLTRLELRIKGSLELTVGAGETANWTGRGVERKKYVVPLHHTSSENALQVNYQVLEKHSIYTNTLGAK